MKARMDNSSLHKFGQAHDDRSELGMSSVSSVALPGAGTIRAGIAFPEGGPAAKMPLN